MKGLWLRKLRKCCSPNTLAYLSLIGCFLVQLTLGSVYTYGNMAGYIISYMNISSGSAGYVTVGNSMWIFGMAVFGLGASMSFGGFIERKLGPISTILIGGWIMSFGVILTSVTIKVHLALICITYGLLTGLGSGVAYGVSLSIPSEWFPRAKGLVSGIIVAGFGLGSMIFDFLQKNYIHPNNPDRYHKDYILAVPTSFLIFGSAYAIIQLIGSIIISRPDHTRTENGGGDEGSLEMFSNELIPCNEVNIRPHQLIYEFDFWILWITFALNSVVAIMILSLHKEFGSTLGIIDRRLVIATAFGAFCNGIGRIFWGFLNDRFTYKALMLTLTTSMALFLGTFYVISQINPNTGQYTFYFIWVVILHLLLSGSFALFPTICLKTFGSKNFAENYGMLFTAFSFSGILTSTLTTGLLEKNEPILYLTPFLIGTGFSVIAALITVFYRGRSLLYKNLNL